MACCPPIPPYRYVPPFAGFTEFTASIPKLYFNVKSQEQRIHAMCELINKLICYADMLGDKVSDDHDAIEELIEEFNKFKDSGFLDYYEKQLEAWINAHMADIISMYVKQVFFGLTLDGHFVAYIPEGSAWEDVIFDTGAVYDLDTYGRLILYYETDSTSDVWQDRNVVNDLSGMLNDFNRRITANENELYNPLEQSEVNVND